jgi:predicted RecA/RadA family phage recombinase
VAARFIQHGDAIDYTPTGEMSAGDVVVIQKLIGVARFDIPANTLGSLAIAGIFEFPKVTGDSTFIMLGTLVYWDATNKRATNYSSGGVNKLLGKAVNTAGDNDPTIRVLLQQLMM